MPCHKTCRILVPQPGIEPTCLPGKFHKKHVYMLFYDVNQGLANWSPTCFCMVCELKLCIFKWLRKKKEAFCQPIMHLWDMVSSIQNYIKKAGRHSVSITTWPWWRKSQFLRKCPRYQSLIMITGLTFSLGNFSCLPTNLSYMPTSQTQLEPTMEKLGDWTPLIKGRGLHLPGNHFSAWPHTHTIGNYSGEEGVERRTWVEANIIKLDIALHYTQRNRPKRQALYSQRNCFLQPYPLLQRSV